MEASEITLLKGDLHGVVNAIALSHSTTTGESGVQEIRVTVKGGYAPDVIVVKQGKPVRLDFYRDETASCSEKVIFSDFRIAKDLPAFKTIPVELTPQKRRCQRDVQHAQHAGGDRHVRGTGAFGVDLVDRADLSPVRADHRVARGHIDRRATREGLLELLDLHHGVGQQRVVDPDRCLVGHHVERPAKLAAALSAASIASCTMTEITATGLVFVSAGATRTRPAAGIHPSGQPRRPVSPWVARRLPA